MDLKRNLPFRADKQKVMVAQTCGKFPMIHHFGRRVVNIVVDVDVQLLAFEVAVHPSVAPSMQGRIVQG